MAITPVDPLVNPFRGPALLARPVTALARTGVARWVGINVLPKVDPLLLRWSGGRISLFAIFRHVELTVPGRKSGIPRTVPLLYFTDGEGAQQEVIVIASSFGRDEHPKWYLNVMAHPEVTLTEGGKSHPYVAREVSGEERRRLFEKATALYPGYADYEERTQAAGRTIPVLALRPA